MTRSERRSGALGDAGKHGDLWLELPTRPEDVAALRRARRGSAMTLAQVIDAARRYGASPKELARRRGPRGEPFSLEPFDSPD